MVGDPIGDMITRIKNAGMAGKDSVILPFSKIKFEIANVLKNEGYIKSIEIIGKDKVGEHKKLELGISYLDKNTAANNGKIVPKINDVLRVSKPSRRTYISLDELKSVLHKKGMCIISSNRGIVSDKSAKEKGVGGELLFRIW